jgi:hypothetical protein
MATPIELIEEIRLLLGKASGDIVDAITSEGADIAESCLIYSIIGALKKDIALLNEHAETLIAERMNESFVSLPDGFVAERRIGSDRKSWDHKGLAAEVSNRVYQSSIDMDTGEVLASPLEMMQKMLDYAAPSYWRVGELNKIGISADDYCQKSEGKVSVVISKEKL